MNLVTKKSIIASCRLILRLLVTNCTAAVVLGDLSDNFIGVSEASPTLVMMTFTLIIMQMYK